MDVLSKFEAKPKPVGRRGPIVLKVKAGVTAQKTAVSKQSEPPAAAHGSPTAAAEPVDTVRPADAGQLVIEKAPQAGFDIQSFLGSFIPTASPVAPTADPPLVQAEGSPTPSAAPAPSDSPLSADATTVAAPAAAPAPKTKQRKRKIVVYKSAEEAEAALAAEAAAKKKKAEGKVPRRKRAMTSQKKAKLVTAVAMLDEIKSHGLPGSRNPPPRLLASEYYLNNRQGFVSAIAKLFDPLRRELAKQKPPTCDDRVGKFGLLPQQEIVLNYLNNYSPYRGLLLYHGLGSGKTCAAISVAEGMMSERPVYIMTPASLRKNFIEEIKFCGAPIYSRDQHWRFEEAAPRSAKAKVLAQVNGIPLSYVSSKRGAWVIDTRKEGNWAQLSDEQRVALDDQLTLAINEKYTVVHYNGIRRDGFNKLKREAKTKRGVDNPFTGAVLVLEEAHNFVGMIVNKLKSKSSLSMDMYNMIMAAEDCKVVFLTGTPFVNYPNEMAIMFNMLRGFMRVHTYRLQTSGPFSQRDAEEAIRRLSTSDVIEYSPTQRTLSVTRDPTGFVRASASGIKVKRDAQGNVNSSDFDRMVRRELEARDVNVVHSEVKEFKALPDDLEQFTKLFLNQTTNELINRDLLSRRVVGLTSYFRSAAETLMPKYDPIENFHVENVPMSDTQFKIYEEARMDERKMDRRGAVKRRKNKLLGVYQQVASTYRIFSRSFCNFVFPPDIGRPMPSQANDKKGLSELDEDVLDNAELSTIMANPDGRYSAEDQQKLEKQLASADQRDYARRIEAALAELERGADEYLSPEGLKTWSPKFLAILERLQEARGSQLVYPQFRTLEGLGILRLVLLANGYTEFKVVKKEGKWALDKPLSNVKPSFVLYSGEEGEEEKEIVRNAFNSDWTRVPEDIVKEMRRIAPNNHRGQVLQTIMITAAGAEGVTLLNVRDVHIVEPYWHPARIRQVIGRARRICSHKALPEADRTVDVWLYLMVFTERQLEEEASTELRNKDKSRVDGVSILTTDQALYEMANIKEHITKQQEAVVQETAIDCTVHSAQTGVPCFAFPEGRPEALAFTPDIAKEQSDALAEANTRIDRWTAIEVEVDGVRYAMREETGELYDLEDYKRLMAGQNVPAARMRVSSAASSAPGAAPGPRPRGRPRQGKGLSRTLQPVGKLGLTEDDDGQDQFTIEYA